MSYKHRIEVPVSEGQSHKIDRKNRNYFWRKEIKKKMHAVGVLFETLDEKDKGSYG